MGTGADLLAVDLVAMRAFSSDASGKFGNNLWESSAIRSWLNGPFLAQFNAEEQALVVPVEHRTILSSSRSDLFTEGTLEMYWDPVPAWCANGWQDAYATRYVDSVRLPDLTLIPVHGEASHDGPQAAAYWLSDAYYGNATMVRCVTKDGFVTMKDATQELGILPVLTVDPERPYGKARVLRRIRGKWTRKEGFTEDPCAGHFAVRLLPTARPATFGFRTRTSPLFRPSVIT